jgi:hypothetical protein
MCIDDDLEELEVMMTDHSILFILFGDILRKVMKAAYRQ